MPAGKPNQPTFIPVSKPCGSVKGRVGLVNPLEKSFYFFKQKFEDGGAFTLEEIMVATGWRMSTVRTYLGKRWKGILKKTSRGWVVANLPSTLQNYRGMMSQTRRDSPEYVKPILKPSVESLVEKAQQSAILALDIYNRPATKFRTEAFIVLMVIAWTALFHAIFEKRGIPYFYKDDQGVARTADGEKKAWELKTCIREFYGPANPPVRQNLDFMIRLRNKIEHRFSPEIDPYVTEECQAMLLNFDELLVEKFSEYYALQQCLCVPLLASTVRQPYQVDALRRFQAKQYTELKQYIDDYKKNLAPEIRDNPKYRYRLYLAPELASRESSSDLVLTFVKGDDLTGTEQVVAVRERSVPVANPGKLKPSQVAHKVKKRIGRPFSTNHHTAAWKYYKVRESGNDPTKCETKYCQYDDVHESYVYTEDWVEFLVLKLADQKEYEKVITYPWRQQAGHG